MNWTVQKISGNSFVTVLTEGDFNLPDQQEMLLDIISRHFWKPGMNILFDHRDLDLDETNLSVIRGASDIHCRFDKQIGSGKTAILMKSITDFGRGRQFELLTGNKSSGKISVFREEEAAVDWLTARFVSAGI